MKNNTLKIELKLIKVVELKIIAQMQLTGLCHIAAENSVFQPAAQRWKSSQEGLWHKHQKMKEDEKDEMLPDAVSLHICSMDVKHSLQTTCKRGIYEMLQTLSYSCCLVQACLAPNMKVQINPQILLKLCVKTAGC